MNPSLKCEVKPIEGGGKGYIIYSNQVGLQPLNKPDGINNVSPSFTSHLKHVSTASPKNFRCCSGSQLHL
eukprot:m.118283 g.118283  ORF g.118283 m.118283 type:complete len:70 (+) comp9338_c0_seq17:1375-1584(+)